MYVVTTKCGGATSKEAEKRFTKHSVNGDIKAIDEMMMKGELIPLNGFLICNLKRNFL